MANVDTHEEFWGITLSGDQKIHAWNPANDEQEIEHKIQVTQACLGSKAKDGERNVVEVTTEDDNGRKISCAVVSLRVGFIECIHLELGFTNAVKFALKEGSGPLSLCGVHLMALPLDLSDEDSSSKGEEMIPQLVETHAKTLKDAEAVEEVVMKKSKKRVASDEKEAVVAKKKKGSVEKEDPVVVVVDGSKKGKKKVAVIESDEDVEGEEVDDEDDEGDDEAVQELVLTEAKEDNDTVSESGDEEPEFGDDIDSEDDDGDDDDDSDDDDDDMADFLVEDGMETDEDDDDDGEGDDEDEDDDDEDSEESEEEAPQQVKPKQSVKTNGVKNEQEKSKAAVTPAKGKIKPTKPQKGKENSKVNSTPTAKEDKTKEKKSSTPKRTPEELRTLLLKSPNLPKKYEKFANFMKNNMKVADVRSQKELWEFVQKNKK